MMQNPNFSGKFPKSSCLQLFIYLLCILSYIFRILLFSQLFFIIIILLLRNGITNTDVCVYQNGFSQPEWIFKQKLFISNAIIKAVMMRIHKNESESLWKSQLSLNRYLWLIIASLSFPDFPLFQIYRGTQFRSRPVGVQKIGNQLFYFKTNQLLRRIFWGAFRHRREKKNIQAAFLFSNFPSSWSVSLDEDEQVSSCLLAGELAAYLYPICSSY